MAQEKLCTNCRYYFQHYINYKGDFKEAYCAHCAKRHIGMKRLEEMIKNETPCELWESEKELKAKRKNYVKNEIERLTALLDDYVQLLKLDE